MRDLLTMILSILPGAAAKTRACSEVVRAVLMSVGVIMSAWAGVETSADAPHASSDLDALLNRRTTEFERSAGGSLHEAAARRAEIEAVWDDRLESCPKVYVGYGESLRERVIVQFEEGWLEGQVMVAPGFTDEAAVRGQLREVLTDVLSWRVSPDQEEGFALLEGQIPALPHESRSLAEPGQAASDLLDAEPLRWHSVGEGEGRKRCATFRTPLLPDHLSRRAERFWPLVVRHARRFNLDPGLVAAVIEVESAYNPKAVSPARALGLMQVVPNTGGRDAHSICPDLPKVLTREHYFDPNVNIQLGSAYLHILMHRTFRDVTDGRSRLLLTLAAYNAGPGAVANALTSTRSTQAAVAYANRIDHVQLERALQDRLPARETRNYVNRVIAIYGEGIGQ